MINNQKRIIVGVVVLILLIAGFYFLTNNINKYTGYFVGNFYHKTAFDKCIDNQDIVLYLNTDNLINSIKNIRLVENLKKVDVFNCFDNPEYCFNKGIYKTPVWVINGKRFNGNLSFFEFKKIIKCSV